MFEADWTKRQGKTTVNWDGEEQAERDGAWAVLQTCFAETPIKADERPEAVEVPMEAELPGPPKLVGILDLVRSGGTIVEFKTAGQTPTPDKVAHLHETQLTFYGLLYREATGKREGGSRSPRISRLDLTVSVLSVKSVVGGPDRHKLDGRGPGAGLVAVCLALPFQIHLLCSW